MPRRAASGASLDQLLTLALPLLRQSQCRCPRTGPGRKPDYDDWKLAAMILCGVLKKKKSKSAQYAFIQHNAAMLLRVLDLARLPARSTFFERYGRVWPLVQEAIALQGRTALREHVADAATVAADKSLIAAVGPVWHKRHRQRGIVPKGLRGLDREAAWGYSDYHDWIYGYSFEVVVTAPPNRSGTAAFPLLASVDIASASEQRSFALKVPQLPRSTRFVDVDSGYDTDDLAELGEDDRAEAGHGHETLRRVSAARCGRVSYLTQDGRRDLDEDLKLFERFVRFGPQKTSVGDVATAADVEDPEAASRR